MIHAAQDFISVRIFADSANQDEAREIFESFLEEIREYGQIKLKKIERYWKNKEQFEILLDLIPESETGGVVSQVTKKLSNEWDTFSQSYVWNYSEGNFLVDERVKWINVEVIEV